MANSKNGKSDLKEIFMTSTIRNKTKTRVIPNTAQNMYLNQVPDSKSNYAYNKNEIKNSNNEAKNNLNSDSDTETETETETETIIGSDTEIEQNDELDDEYENKNEENSSDIDDNDDDDENDTNREELDADNNKQINTEYNEDSVNEKDTETNNKEDDDCIYQYDDLVEERDTERQIFEIPTEQRMTDPKITHYEKVRILGIRSKQIALGSKIMVKHDDSMGPVELAKYELLHKTTPLIIKRPLPDNTFEIWKVSELNIDDDIDSLLIKQELEESYNNNDNQYIINTF